MPIPVMELEVVVFKQKADFRLDHFPFLSFSLYLFSWGSYKINQTQDKIGVFVSIVSTKIPFKGTGKEYIGDDISEIASAVKVDIFILTIICICKETTSVTLS